MKTADKYSRDELEVLWTIADRLVRRQKKQIKQQDEFIKLQGTVIKNFKAGLKFAPGLGWLTEEEYQALERK
jgi:hypothetical protein